MRWVLLSALLLTGCQSEKEKAFINATKHICMLTRTDLTYLSHYEASARKASAEIQKLVDNLPEVRSDESLNRIHNCLTGIPGLFSGIAETFHTADSLPYGPRQDEFREDATKYVKLINERLDMIDAEIANR